MKTRGVRNLGEWDKKYAQDRRDEAIRVLAQTENEAMPLATLAQIMGVPPNGLRSTLAPNRIFAFEIVRHPHHRRGVCLVKLNQAAKVKVEDVARLVGVDSRPRLAGPEQKK